MSRERTELTGNLIVSTELPPCGLKKLLLERIMLGEFSPEMAVLLEPVPLETVKLKREWIDQPEAEAILGGSVSEWIRLRRIKGAHKVAGAWQISAVEIENCVNFRTASESAAVWGVEEHLVTELLQKDDGIRGKWGIVREGHFWRIPLETINRVNAQEKRTVLLSEGQRLLEGLGITENVFYDLLKDPTGYLGRAWEDGEMTIHSTLRGLKRGGKYYQGMDILDFARLASLVKTERAIFEEWATSAEVASSTGYKRGWIQTLTRLGFIGAKKVKIFGPYTYRYPPNEVKRMAELVEINLPPSKKSEKRKQFNERVQRARINPIILRSFPEQYSDLTLKQECQLLILIKKGEEEAAQLLLDLYSPLVKKIARQLFSSDFSLDERIAFGKRGLYDAAIYLYNFKMPFVPYAAGAIRHAIFDGIRQERTKHISLDAEREMLSGGRVTLGEVVSIGGKSLEERVLDNISIQEILEGTGLSFLQKELLKLVYIEGQGINEAAKQLGLTMDEARSTLSFLRETLSDFLKSDSMVTGVTEKV